MFPWQRPAIPVFKPDMEAAGIEPAQGSPGRCCACPETGAYAIELRSGRQAALCGTCLSERKREWVYLIEGGDHVKIGHSNDPVGRLKTHQAGSPVQLRIVYLIEGGRQVEAFLHRELVAGRLAQQSLLTEGAA